VRPSQGRPGRRRDARAAGVRLCRPARGPRRRRPRRRAGGDGPPRRRLGAGRFLHVWRGCPGEGCQRVPQPDHRRGRARLMAAMDAASHSTSWSTSQLVEFLAVLSEQTDEAGALRAAVERVLESLDAEVGVLFSSRTAPTVVGLGTPDARSDEQVARLVAAAQSGAQRVHLAGVGDCRLTVVALDVGGDAFRLLVARAGPDEFVPEEMLLLRGMAWVLNLALRPLRVLTALHERQRVLEQMARVQQKLASRAPLPEVFDAVTEGALGLFGCELATLYLADGDELILAAVSAVSAEHRPPDWPQPVRSSIGRAAYTTGVLVRSDDFPASPHALPVLVQPRARPARAAPAS